MAPRLRLVGALALTAALALQGGCGGGSSSKSVSGAVTFNGQPLAEGTIEFAPEAGAGLPVGSMISEGRYALPNPPGLAPGSYLVRISTRGGPSGGPDAPPDVAIAAPDGGETIPREYNDESTLRAEVKADSSAPIDFSLTGRRSPARRKAPIR